MTEDEINAVLSKLQFNEPEAEAPRSRLSDVSLSRPRIDESFPVTLSPSRESIAPMASSMMSMVPSATGRASVPAFGGELSVQGGYLPIRGAPPVTHHGFSFEKRFAGGGEVDAALHTVRQHFDEGGFLDSLRGLFSGDDYQSTGDKVVKDGEVQWGNPESAADFSRADKARMALDKRPAVGRPEDDVTGSVSAPPRRPQIASTSVAVPQLEAASIPFAQSDKVYAMPGANEAAQPFLPALMPIAQDVKPMAFTSTATPAPAPAAAAINTAMSVAPKISDRAAAQSGMTDLTPQQADYIIRTIAAESSGHPAESQGIANVIMNRINSGRFGATPEHVLFSKNQFEPWSSKALANYPMKIKPGSDRYQAAAAALDAALQGDDNTGGATFFWGPGSQYALGRDVPGFARKYPGFNIGATRFHRETREEGGEVEGYGEGGQIVKHALDAIRGWHGSGKQFKQFDASKMGSGAGELFGRGVYITDTPNFARTYRNMALKGSPEPKIGGVPVSDLYMQFERQAKGLPPQDAKRIYDKMQVLEDMVGDPSDSLALREILKSSNYQPEAREWFESKVVPKLKTPGGLYEVEIKAKPEQFLQWQKPFGEQSPFIQDALRPKAVEMAERANQARAQMLERGVDYARRPFTPERIEELRKISAPEDIGGLNLYGGIHRDYGSVNPNEWQPEANQFLRDQGVVGNTYRDMAGKGKVQNYVVYDPADTEILNRYAHGGEVDDALRVVREHHADGEAVGQAPFFTFEPTPDSVDRQATRQPAYNPADYRWSDAGSTEGERLTRALGVEGELPKGETFMSAAPTGWDKYMPQRVPGSYWKRWGEAMDENAQSISEGWKAAKEGNYGTGALGMLGGAAGTAFSPLTALERVLVRDPYLRITGNLKDAQAAEMAADFALTGGVRGMAKQFHKAGNLERMATEPWSKTRMPMSAIIGAGVTANTLTPDEAQASTPIAMVKPEGNDMRDHFESGGLKLVNKLANTRAKIGHNNPPVPRIFPEMAERYPLTKEPVEAFDKKKGEYYLAKDLTPEAIAIQKARKAAQATIDKGDYTPFFAPENRFDVDPTKYPDYTPTTSVLTKKPATQAKYDAIAGSPEASTRLDEAYARGLQQQKDAENWYFMGQLEKHFIEEYGPELGPKMFKQRFADPMAATTGGADPTSNLMMAHYGNYLKEQGLPVPEHSYEYPFPIGGRYAAGNMDQYRKMIMEGQGITHDNPKRYNFSYNFTGHKGPTIDEQMSQMFDPKMNMPPAGTYGHYENALANRAANAGVDPRYFQEVAWAGKKDADSKAGFKAQPMIGIVNEAIERTHQITGMPRDEIVRRGLVRAEIPLYGAAGATAAGAVAPELMQGQGEAPAPAAEAPMTEERKRGGSIVDRALMLVSR
ncbi:Cell wall hydrolase, SleB [uncultured Caudovirales phage]|uniref:Cell wall hydrolase, SleB n=1 Tax=uncultured Caudovirales phage TaxID=2100421 RepID=A0A6J5LBW6_9CAUD|nr:Cell wall hydrolase, SleB [uncultured Caudovirales phage]